MTMPKRTSTNESFELERFFKLLSFIQWRFRLKIIKLSHSAQSDQEDELSEANTTYSNKRHFLGIKDSFVSSKKTLNQGKI